MTKSSRVLTIVYDDLKLEFDARAKALYVIIAYRRPVGAGEGIVENRGPVIWKVGDAAINSEALEDALEQDARARGN